MNGLILPVMVTQIRSKVDGSISVSIDTQELSPTKAGELFSLRGKIAMMYLSPKDVVTQKEIDQLDAMQADMPKGKTPSKRMRDVLWIIWKQDNEGYKDFPMYYEVKMNKYIEDLKLNIKD